MDIRTKLVFALVGVALGSMLALGTFTYRSARELLKENALEQLEGLAETKKEGLGHILSGWVDRSHLIASRTQLRLSLRERARTDSEEARTEAGTSIERILADALHSVETVELLAVHDREGRLVASVSRGPQAEEAAIRFRESALGAAYDADAPTRYQGIEVLGEKRLLVGFAADLELEGDPLGTLQVVFDGREVVELAGNLEGLGETGETMVLVRELDGMPRLLHLRYPRPARQPVLQIDDPDDPLARVWTGEEGRYWKDVVDYRGEPVWMATRVLPEIGWGVIVKFDEAEENVSVDAFRRNLISLGLSLAAFAVLLGTVLGFRFSRPILRLAAVAGRIREGALDARAEVGSEDEIGLFARTFNEMAEELERQLGLLREYQKFFDVSLDMLCIAGTDGYFKRVNPEFVRTLGWTEEDLLSQPFTDFVHPEDVEATHREVEKLSQGIPTISFENRYRCADGTYKHLLWTSHPDLETGTLYAIARDITELKRVQERFQLALESSPSAMVLVDSEGRIELLNRAAGELFGYEPAELIGRSVDVLVPDDVRERHAELRRAYTEDPTARPMGHGHEFRARRKDGTIVVVEIGLSPIRTVTGVHILSSIVDLSRQKAAEMKIEVLASRIDTLTRQLEAAHAKLRAQP
ncbi:MAG: PAS domain S-box protein [Gemmatimonadota bacterium]|nr:MAG: PAS domain S-box protein [Gemmatimonadota bacterium]